MDTTSADLQAATLTSIDLDAMARSRLQLLDSLKEGIYRIDQHGMCVFMNRAAGSMLGYGLGEARGQQMHELHHPCLCCVDGCLPTPAADCPIHGGPLASSHLNRRDIFHRRDGTSFPAEWSFHPLCDGNVYSGAMINFSDITGRLKDERRLQLQIDVSRILGAAAAVETAVPEILRSICDGLDLDGAWFFEIAQPARNIVLADSWRWSDHGPALAPDLELARRIAVSGAPLWISDWTEANRSGDLTYRSGFGIPLALGGRAIGVMEFASREARAEDPDVLKTMLLLGDAIAQFVERRRAELAHGRLIAILEATTAFAGVAIDLQGEILSVNAAVEQIFGYLPAELLGRSLTCVIPDYRRDLRESGWSLEPGAGPVTEPTSRRIRSGGIHKCGRAVPLELSLGECAENGRRILTFIIADTTERDAAEEALRSQTQLVQLIVSSMGDGVIVADENYEFLVVNPAAERMVPPVRGKKSLLDTRPALDGPEPFVFHADGVTPYGWNDIPIVRAIRGESIDKAEILLRSPAHPEGTWLSETARPLLDSSGRLRGGVVISRDITEQKASAERLRHAKEEAESANRAKSEFLSRMSHELRTPMNAILGFAQLLEMDPLTEEQMDGVTRLLKAGRHLLTLINEILDLSRIEAGRLNLKMDRVDPHDLLPAAFELMRPLMAQRNIRLIEPPRNEGGCAIHGDPQRLMQVLLNLLSNAVKYNREDGSVTVSLSRHSSTSPGGPPPGQLRISIGDTGTGIAAGDLKKLFVPFERLAADRGAIEGTGLGLALSKHLVQLMHGGMGVESTLGEGSTFWVDMPLHRDQVEAPGAPAGLASPSAGVTHPSSVLYIESNPANIALVETVLNRLPGFSLMFAADGRLGLDLARKQIPELILLGAPLADMPPVEVLRELQGDEKTSRIPVVAVSSDVTEATRNALIEAGARAFITQPIGVRVFLDVITEIISHEVAA